jgi:broad specificity phosphatase PhoE
MKTWLDISEHSSVAVVTHAFVVAWAVAQTFGGPWDTWLRLPVDNATLTTLELDRHGEVLLRRFNARPWSS